MKRKPTPAQIAARERFAEMARSGAFKRKRNPAQSMQTFEIIDTTTGESEGFYKAADAQLAFEVWARSNGYKSFSEMKQKEKFGARGRFIAVESQQRKRNPAKKTVSQKISQLTREGYPQKQAIAIALSEERAGKVKRNPAPRGFVKADDYTIEVFNKYGMKPYDAVYMQTKGGRGEPIYDLTILKHENGKYLAAHGSVIVKQEFDRVSDAAAYLEEWYINNRRPAARRINPRASNPIILVSDKPKRVTRKSNPTKYRDTARAVPESRVLYSVHLATQRPSIASGGMFTSKQNAMRVAQVIADSTGKTYAVSRLERK